MKMANQALELTARTYAALNAVSSGGAAAQLGVELNRWRGASSTPFIVEFPLPSTL
jgi:hypothetical protein